ncbi:hypothetical protein Asp14428_33900 [Actinoplanes sp. NBRC 14428]|nr:hypothetical protein Asp14428_33900 [Actinoplanes sp. NBRC 14428]
MNLVARRVLADLGSSEEVPPVSGDVEEDGDATIGFGTRWAYEGNASLGHPPVRIVEVINAKEEPDPSGRLMTDGRALVFSIGAGKQKPGLRAGRADDHPAFGPSVVGERRRVLDEVEPEYAGKEGDGRVVLVNDQGHQVDLHSGRVRVAMPLVRTAAR